jgi:hypothetical protein
MSINVKRLKMAMTSTLIPVFKFYNLLLYVIGIRSRTLERYRLLRYVVEEWMFAYVAKHGLAQLIGLAIFVQKASCRQHRDVTA